MKYLLVIGLLLICSVANAKQYIVINNNKPTIIHTRPGPVIVHRILPPYGMRKHIYARPRRARRQVFIHIVY